MRQTITLITEYFALPLLCLSIILGVIRRVHIKVKLFALVEKLVQLLQLERVYDMDFIVRSVPIL